MIPLIIQPSSEGKGRAFQSTLIAHVTANHLWPNGAADSTRPIWAVVGSTDTQLRPFLANWTRGRKAQVVGGNDRYEILKSAGYQTAVQRFPEGSVATIFLPDLVRADPGMVEPEAVRFVMLPSAAAAREQVIPEADDVARWAVDHCGAAAWFRGKEGTALELARQLVPHAYLFAVFLDRRTRCPIVADGRFYIQLMLACLAGGLAEGMGGGCTAYGLVEGGIDPVGTVAFYASQDDVEELVAREVARYFTLTGGQ